MSKSNKFGSKVVASIEKKLDSLWQRAIEREREIENKKKAIAVIYCEANHKGKACEDCLDLREEFCREYCTRENLEVLRVFRETSESPGIPSQFDEIQKFIEQHKEISFLVHLHHFVGGSVVVAADLRKAPKNASN